MHSTGLSAHLLSRGLDSAEVVPIEFIPGLVFSCSSKNKPELLSSVRAADREVGTRHCNKLADAVLQQAYDVVDAES